ncbi:hypothetical protein FOZ61_006365 [Perkinsus olseni]|uniref:Uncharacterized protein n=1 Tax=Perkinsus olseni TaxID=32597 RepID=A0A7J6LDP5_PEROL|nr:hypothetical protein FOZ61_006365 [Perkinsus olseni]KAF4661128.1 hypothetical protein FOL46_005857 [Perkinsus olseni]
MSTTADFTAWTESLRETNLQMLTGDRRGVSNSIERLREIIKRFSGTPQELLELLRAIVGDAQMTVPIALILDHTKEGGIEQWHAVGEEWLAREADVRMLEFVPGEMRNIVGSILRHSLGSPRAELVPTFLRSVLERYAEQLPAILTSVHCEVMHVCVRADELALARWIAERSPNISALGIGVSEAGYRRWYEVALSFAPTDVPMAISAAQRAFEPRVDPTKGDKATRNSKDAWVPCIRALNLYLVLRMIDLGGSVGSPASVGLGNLFPRGVPSHLKKYVGGMLAGGRRGDGGQDVTGDAMLVELARHQTADLSGSTPRGDHRSEGVKAVIGKLITMSISASEGNRHNQARDSAERLDEQARRLLGSEGLLGLVESRLLPLIENRRALGMIKEISEVYSHVPLERVTGMIGLPQTPEGAERFGILVDLFNSCRSLCGTSELNAADGFVIFQRKGPADVHVAKASRCMDVALNGIGLPWSSRQGMA